MRLSFARACADRLIARLAPWCERIEIAGSVRRERAEVGDIDLVAVPRLVGIPDLLGMVSETINSSAREIRAWCHAEGWHIDREGPQYMVWVARGVQVDLWWASPSTFGTLWLCRTGSKEHNISLCMRALDRGGRWDPHHGLHISGRIVAETEESIYSALGMPFLDPVRERDGAAVRRIRAL